MGGGFIPFNKIVGSFPKKRKQFCIYGIICWFVCFLIYLMATFPYP